MKSLFLLVALAAGVAAQQPTKMLFWDTVRGCGPKVHLAPTDIVECDFVYNNGAPIAYLRHNGILLAGSYSDSGEYFVIDAFIKNATGDRLLVAPGSWALTYYRTEQDYTGNKPMKTEPVLDPNKIAKHLQRVKWTDALKDMLGQMQTNTSTFQATDDYGNAVTGYISTPDYAARQRAADRTEARKREAATRAQLMLDGALFAHTLFDTEDVSGMVYFKKNKDAKVAVLSAIIGDTVYVFDIHKQP